MGILWSTFVVSPVALELLEYRALLCARGRAYFSQAELLEIGLPILCPPDERRPHTAIQTGGVLQPYGLADVAHVPIAQWVQQYQRAAYSMTTVFAHPQHKVYAEETIWCWALPDASVGVITAQLCSLLEALFAQPLNPDTHSYPDAMMRRLGIDPQQASLDQLKQASRRLGMYSNHGVDAQLWEQHLFRQFVEPTLGLECPLLLTDCPTFAGYPPATILVYWEGLVIAAVAELHGQPVGVVWLDRLLLIDAGTRQMARVRWQV